MKVSSRTSRQKSRLDLGCKEVEITKELDRTPLYIRVLVVYISLIATPSRLLCCRLIAKIQKSGLSKTLVLCCEDAREIRYLRRRGSSFCRCHRSDSQRRCLFQHYLCDLHMTAPRPTCTFSLHVDSLRRLFNLTSPRTDLEYRL